MINLMLLGAFTAHAADHIDSPGPVAEPAADITDLYAWTSTSGTKINLIMNVGPLGTATGFSDAVTYVFNIESSAAFGETGTTAQIACEFYDGTNIECWAAGTYVTGDPSATAGISNTANSLKVFAGERNDPFFMEFTGFNNAVAAVVAAGVVPGAAVCPTVDAATSAALVDALTNGGAPVDTFAGSTVQSLVVQIDKILINEGGPYLAISAATYVAN